MKRQANLSVLFRLLKRKQAYGILAFIFVILLVFLVPLIFFLGIIFKGENDYNFNDIKKYGLQKDAKITYIKTLYNLTINDEHPVIISYEYNNNGKNVKDTFETLDLENIAGFNIGTAIKILVYNNQSMIKDVDPYTSPIQLFYLIPGSFLVAGAILLLIALIPALKIYKLYRFGVVKDAFIISIGFSGEPVPFSRLKEKFSVNYYFIDKHANKIFGESELTDILLMQKKAGDTIKIFVSEKDESKSCLIPNLEILKNNWDLSTT